MTQRVTEDRAPDSMPQGGERRCDPVLVLLNPAARVPVAGGTPATVLQQHMRRQGLRCTVMITASEEEARQRADEAVRSGEWRTVVAAGGDGTVHAVAEGLLRGQANLGGDRSGAPDAAEPAQVSLGILPLGTMNNIARSLGIPEDLGAACQVLARAQPRPLDAGFAGDHFFIEVVGIGLEAQLMPLGNVVKGHMLGHLGALLNIAGVLRRFQPQRLTIEADGWRFRTRALQVAVCNAPRYGLSFAAAPEARMDDGWLDVVIYGRISPWQLLRHYISIAGGGRDYRLRTRTLRARRIAVIPEHTAWPVHADAEWVAETPVTVRVVPGALRVLAPPPNERQDERSDEMPPLEVMLRAAAPPGAALGAPTLTGAARSSRTLAASTESARQAIEAASDEARNVVGVEPPHRSARRASLLGMGYVGALASALVMTLAVRRINVLPGDMQIMRAVQRRRGPRQDRFWRAVAAPGFPVMSTPLVILSAAAFWLLRLRVEAGFIVLANGTNALNFGIKRVVRRERPAGPLVRVVRVINEPGFPSGHVMHYLSFYGFLAAAALANLRPSRLRTALVSACTAMIGLVGPSRVYLGAHWPSDVMAGYLYGGLYLGGLLEAYARVKEWQSSQED